MSIPHHEQIINSHSYKKKNRKVNQTLDFEGNIWNYCSNSQYLYLDIASQVLNYTR